MKRFLLLALAFAGLSLPAMAQNGFNGWCQTGGKNVSTQGLQSTTTVQQSYPKCTVEVFLTGTTTHATITKDKIGTPLANPFTANTDGSWLFFAADGQGYDVTMSGGTAPNVFPQPFTLTDLINASGGSGGSGCTGSGFTPDGQLCYTLGSGFGSSPNITVQFPTNTQTPAAASNAIQLTNVTHGSTDDSFNVILQSAADIGDNLSFAPHLIDMECANSGRTTLGCEMLLNTSDADVTDPANGGLNPIDVRMRGTQSGSHAGYTGIQIESTLANSVVTTAAWTGINIGSPTHIIGNTVGRNIGLGIGMDGGAVATSYEHAVDIVITSTPTLSNYTDIVSTDNSGTTRLALGAGPTSTNTFLGPMIFKAAAPGSGTDCLQIDSTGTVSNTGAPCGSGGGAPTWNSITNPTGTFSLFMGANTSTFNFGSATGTTPWMSWLNSSGVGFGIAGDGSLRGVGSSGTHGMVIPAGTAPPGSAGAVVYASDATNGYAEVDENAAGLSRICTVGNGLCTGSVGVSSIDSQTGAFTFGGSGVSHVGNAYTFSGSGSSSTPSGFPQQILGFSGPATAFVPDGLAWDSYGIGGPSNAIFVKGEYWVAVSGYTTSATSSGQAIGLWHGPSLSALVPYSGNPVITNTAPAWSAACIEGPDLNADTAGNIYISFNGYSSACDSEGPGAIGIVSTTTASFPTGWSAFPSVATIPKPSNLNWLYRPFIIEIGGICYDYSNGGDNSNNPIIASFHTTGTCATTETNPSAWSSSATTVFGITQAWEGSTEIQDPQVWQDPSGLYIMVYANFQGRTFGYATSTDPASNTWTKNASNPAFADGVSCSVPYYGVGCGPYLPRITQDSSGDYWMMASTNDSPAMNIYRTTGPVLPGMGFYPWVTSFQNGTSGNDSTGIKVNSGSGTLPAYFMQSAASEATTSLNTTYTSPNWKYTANGSAGVYKLFDRGAGAEYLMAVCPSGSAGGTVTALGTTCVGQVTVNNGTTVQTRVNPGAYNPTFHTNEAWGVNPTGTAWIDTSGNLTVNSCTGCGVGGTSNPMGAAFTAPPSQSTLTWVNQSTSTATDEPNGLLLQIPAHSGDSLRGIFKSPYPSTPYTYTICINPNMMASNFAGEGIVVSDGTNYVTFGVVYNSGFGWSYTTWNSSFAGVASPNSGSLISATQLWLRLTDDGTNFNYYISYNGYDWSSIPLLTVGRTSYLSTPTKVGIYANVNNATFGASMFVTSWTGI